MAQSCEKIASNVAEVIQKRGDSTPVVFLGSHFDEFQFLRLFTMDRRCNALGIVDDFRAEPEGTLHGVPLITSEQFVRLAASTKDLIAINTCVKEVPRTYFDKLCGANQIKSLPLDLAVDAFGGRRLVMEEYERVADPNKGHYAGTFSTEVLKRLELLLPPEVEATAETGCGKSTILFSNISRNHTVFAFDDRDNEKSSVRFYEESPLIKADRIAEVFGPTQVTLRNYSHRQEYDVVLLDGPHGYPFPEFEYLMFYPHIKVGGTLIVDDVHIPTIGRMADFLAEDDMWSLVDVVSTTAMFRRTDAPMFDPESDGWILQKYNRRRTSPVMGEIFLDDGPVFDRFSSRKWAWK